MVALQMEPSLFIDYGYDLTSLHYIPGFHTLKIRCGESHFQQLQELELYVLNSEVMSSVKSSSSTKSGGLCQLKQHWWVSRGGRSKHLVSSEPPAPFRGVDQHLLSLLQGLIQERSVLPTVTISTNTNHRKGNNSSIFRRLVKIFTRIDCEDTAV